MDTGDILFWKYKPTVTYDKSWQGLIGHLADVAIAGRSGGPITHVEIVSSGSLGQSIGALTSGVTCHPIPDTWSYCSRIGAALPELTGALRWLFQQVGTVYGWGDILNQALTLIPNAPTVQFNRSMDCSDLAVRFLDRAGYELPAWIRESPQDVTPYQLFNALPTTAQ